MQLEHSFSVPVGIEEAWKILLDIERVGRCMPGAAIDSVDGDDFTGTVKVKLGPINLTYKGHATFVEKDAGARRAVINARGRDARGNGTAAATVTATLRDAGGSTTVQVNTDLDITGKPAQFGRGVMVDVGNKLLGQFAESLAATLERGQADANAGSAAQVPAPQAPQPPEPLQPPGPPEGESPTSSPTPGEAEAAAGAPDEHARPKQARPAVPADVEQASEAEAAAETATPSYSTPGGVAPQPGHGIPGHQPVPSVDGHEAGGGPEQHRQHHHDIEPIDLLKHAGPAVGKRLAPVAVALVVVLMAVHRARRRRDG